MNSLIGQSLGRYHILEQLGEGGMAVVYKAHDTRLERDVAVKVIRTERLTLETMGKTLKRFEREAKALAKLTHPNIVPITDYGEHDGKPYLVMPYLPGGTLKQQLKGKPMPWEDSVRMLIPIARALHYAHQQGIIHRDVKPSNILITQSREPMLTDFGIAKILLDTEETADLTGTGTGVGTPEYMAPEQVTGTNLDQRVDIYSLGIVLYEMVTGRKPYTADTPMAVLFKHASEPLPRPGSFAPDLPDKVEHVLFKALAKRLEDRYPDIEDFADALEKISRGGVSSSHQKRTASPTQKIHQLQSMDTVIDTETNRNFFQYLFGKKPDNHNLTNPTKTVSGFSKPLMGRKKLGWGFWWLWLLMGTIGTFPLSIVSGLYDNSINFPLFLSTGAFIGIGQWLTLRKRLQKAWQWILVTFLAWVICSFALPEITGSSYKGCGDVFLSGSPGVIIIDQGKYRIEAKIEEGNLVHDYSNICTDSHWLNTQSFLVFGLGGLVGYVQWLFLRNQIKRSYLWIFASMFAWMMGIYPAGKAFGGRDEWYLWLSGIIYTIISGWAILKLLNQDIDSDSG